MARNLYGCTSADYAMTDDGQQVAGAGPFPVFDAFTGGAAITDLTDLDGNAISQVTFADDGYLRYYSPDNDKRVHWLDTGQGRRIGIRPVDLTGETGLTPDLSIGTVTTGTADVTKSGTLEAPVFSFVLPSAGANGVNTAAIQDGAVTDAKVSDVALAKVTGAGTAAGLNVPASGDATSGQVVKGSDSRLTDTRTPKAHKASHATGQADALAPSDIGAVPATRTLNPGTGLTGGGDLSADRTLGVAAGGIGTTQLADGAVTIVKLTGAYGAKTSAYTITPADSVIAADTTSGAFALTLPAASASTGKTLRIIKTAGANVLTVQRAGSDTILPSSGTRTSVAFPSDCAMGEMLLCSNGSAWHVVSGQASDETVGSRLYKWSQALAGGSTTAAVGWRLVSYDSGDRNISTLVDGTYWTATAGNDIPTLRRIGNSIYLAGKVTSKGAWSGQAVLTPSVPAGFRSRATGGNFTRDSRVAFTYTATPVLAPGARLYVDSFDNLDDDASGTTLDLSHTWLTKDALPTSLPGVAL